jgi:DNA-binding GntR family transcriptional regulator
VNGAYPADERGLAADRQRLGRTSTAERVADVLRDRITDGSYAPGAQLSEESVTAALQISRNTLREAFRLLAHERLLVHELNRGVFVRQITAHDVADIYRVRRIVECTAVRAVTDTSPRWSPGLAVVARAVDGAEEAAKRGAWVEVGTADVHFHRALTALADSPRIDELMDLLGAELRLVFHTMPDTRALHEPYVPRNRAILARLQAGDGPGADALLAAYLDDAESALLKHLAATSVEG